MKIERTKNASRNIVYGGLLKLYQTVIPFLMRTIMIYFMGIQYLGLNSLFTSILQVLNLAELGVGSAMVYSMYKPIAEDNKSKICALMKLYRTYYRCIGIIIGVIGIMLLPLLPKLVNGSLPNDLNIYILYLLELGATVLSYWLFAYKNCLLNAHQRVDVISKISIITNTIKYLLQIVVIVFVKNYYIYLIIALATQVAHNIITAMVATRYYPQYFPEGKLEVETIKDINQRVRDLFTSKLGYVIINSADTVVISAFLGLNILAIYQNYYFIMSSIIGVVAIIFHSCMAGIGNSVIVETKEKNFYDLKKLTLLISWVAGFCTCCLLCLYQPFMKIWVGKEYMLDFSAVVCFCVYYYVYEMSKLLDTYKDAAGIWHEDRFRPFVIALTNLGLNLCTVKIWGIYGILISTIIPTLLIGVPWILKNLFTKLFVKKQLQIYVKELLKHIIIVIITCTVCYVICNIVNLADWPTFILRCIICMIVPNVMFFIAYRKRTEFAQILQLFIKLIKRT